jgi:plasmid stabilization system protein ParE
VKVVISPRAASDLDEIWNWNVDSRDIHNADAYLAFLLQRIGRLRKTYSEGKIVPTRPDLRYVLMIRRTGGHGHVAAYSIEVNEVVVAHIYHTAQNWQGSLSNEP